MAHFAKIDNNDVVIEVIVIDNSELWDEEGNEVEENGIAFCEQLFPEWDGYWKKTSYNANIRGNYAEIGGTYDSDRDAFLPKQQYASWTLNEETFQWEPPIEMPSQGDPESTDPDPTTGVLTWTWNEEAYQANDLDNVWIDDTLQDDTE